MEPKEYQVRALRRVGTYLQLLYDWRQKNDKIVSDIGDDAAIDFPGKAWGKMEGLNRPYSPAATVWAGTCPVSASRFPRAAARPFSPSGQST